MLQSSKLSSRFKNISKEKEQEEVIFSDNSAVETDEISDNYSVSLETEYKKALLQKIETIPVWFDYDEQKQRELICSFVNNKLSSEKKDMSDDSKNELIEKLFSAVMGFGPLDYLVAQENVSAIYVNGLNSVHIEIAGKILNTEMKLNQSQIDFILKNIFNLSETKPDINSYIWHCKLNNILISAILPPVAENGANIIIKKVSISDLDMRTLVDKGMLNKDLFDFLIAVCASKKNIIISGDANSGKTWFVDTLLKTSMQNKRGILLEEYPQMLSQSENLMKFNFASLKSSYDFEVLFSNLLKMNSEYLILDFNNPYYFSACVSGIFENQGAVITLRSSSVDNAITKFMTAYMSEGKYSDKLAKSKFLSTFDYIVQINKCPDGVRRVTSIVELSQARTSALSVKVIAKWEDNHYETDIAQPLTSIKAGSLAVESRSGSMKERFYSKSAEN